jgi:uncharacterized phage protein (TIGR01671 family)
MREILFRGKHTRTGEWVEGLLWKKKYNHDKLFISCFPDKDDNEEIYIIKPETVGQYTGLCDKNGKKIFEGDIIRGENWLHTDHNIHRVAYHDNGFYFIDKDNDAWNPDHIREWEIIGNIHDNPELLKGE